MIPAKVGKLESRGIVHPSISTWEAQCVTEKNNDRTVRVCQDCCALNALVKTDNGRLGDGQMTFDRLSVSKYLSALELASGFSYHHRRRRHSQDGVPRCRTQALGVQPQWVRTEDLARFFCVPYRPAPTTHSKNDYAATAVAPVKHGRVENWLGDISIGS